MQLAGSDTTSTSTTDLLMIMVCRKTELAMMQARFAFRGACCWVVLIGLHWIPSSLPAPLPELLGYFSQCLTTLDECLRVAAPGHYPVCGDCTRFLKCHPAARSAAFISCPSSLLYDKAIGVCNYPGATNCTARTEQTTLTTTSQPSSTIIQTPPTSSTHSTTATTTSQLPTPTDSTTSVPSSRPSPASPSLSSPPPAPLSTTSPLGAKITTVTTTVIADTDTTATTMSTAVPLSSTSGAVPSNDISTQQHEVQTNRITERKDTKKEWEEEREGDERGKKEEDLPASESAKFSADFLTATSTATTPTVSQAVLCNVCHEDGFFGTCNVCSFYFWCYGGRIHAFRQCPQGLEWDDILQQCTLVSSTCRRLRLDFRRV